MNPEAIQAVRKLAHLGYRFTVNGEKIKAKYHGPGEPDPDTVRPLLETVKAHKPEAICFLKSYCPRCGGCCFAPDYEGRPLCMACDWGELVEMYPDLKGKH
jgi:hypothetical protein